MSPPDRAPAASAERCPTADLCFTELLHTVRTGEPACPRRFGRTFWDDLSADDALGRSFDALMGTRLVAEAPAVAAAYPGAPWSTSWTSAATAPC